MGEVLNENGGRLTVEDQMRRIAREAANLGMDAPTLQILIGINDHLEAHGIEPIETDLGEYIVQLAHETPSHIIAPTQH